jgi:single-strand DNA-binding protein
MAQLIGLARVGRDAQVRDAGDSRVANLSLAFDFRAKGEKGTTWADCALWGKQADALAQYLTKGKQVFAVVDDIQLEEFTKGDGTKAAKISGRVSRIDLVSNGERATAPPPPPPPPKKAAADDLDDDIPF